MDSPLRYAYMRSRVLEFSKTLRYFHLRFRSSVMPMHPDQARRESALLQRRVSRVDLDMIRESGIDEEEEESPPPPRSTSRSSVSPEKVESGEV